MKTFINLIKIILCNHNYWTTELKGVSEIISHNTLVLQTWNPAQSGSSWLWPSRPGHTETPHPHSKGHPRSPPRLRMSRGQMHKCSQHRPMVPPQLFLCFYFIHLDNTCMYTIQRNEKFLSITKTLCLRGKKFSILRKSFQMLQEKHTYKNVAKH